jgi:hypothetical protein
LAPRQRPAALRLSTRDQVASLCWSEAYNRDFEKIRECVERSVHNDNLSVTVPGRAPIWGIHCASDKDFGAIVSFLDHWPMLRRPIPPERGKEKPDKFLKYLRDTIEIIPPIMQSIGGYRKFPTEAEMTEGSFGKRGILVLRDVLPPFVGSSTNVEGGRFLTVRIDLSRSKDEIATRVGAVVAAFQGISNWSGYDVSLPSPKAKERKQKARIGLRDRWEVYKVFVRKGNRDARRTAEILLPDSYRYENDAAEVEKDRTAALDKADRRLGHSSYRREEHERIDSWRRKVSAKRQHERESNEKWIRAAVDACKKMIAIHDR